MEAHKVVSHQEWVAARKKHLAKEKEFTRLRDQLSRERRELPWELVEKDYTFEGEAGRLSLRDMFAGRSQLVIYHAMFNPETAGPDTSWTVDARLVAVTMIAGSSEAGDAWFTASLAACACASGVVWAKPGVARASAGCRGGRRRPAPSRGGGRARAARPTRRGSPPGSGRAPGSAR